MFLVRLFGDGNGMLAGCGGCTLLGPEGPAVWLVSLLGSFLRWPVGWLRGECRPYFENYTVDASILKKANVVDLRIDGGSCDFVSL